MKHTQLIQVGVRGITKETVLLEVRDGKDANEFIVSFGSLLCDGELRQPSACTDGRPARLYYTQRAVHIDALP